MPQRIKSRLTHCEIAKELGVSYHTVRAWSQGINPCCCRYMKRALERLIRKNPPRKPSGPRRMPEDARSTGKATADNLTGNDD